MTRAPQPEHDPDRRRLLRRAATVAAATAGVAVTVARPDPARAAPGGNLTLGTTNDAGPATTTVQATAGDGTLVLANTGGAPLRLVPGDRLHPQVLDAEPGTLAVDEHGDLVVRAGTDAGDGTTGWAWTSQWATTSVAVVPTRVLDTRQPDLRRAIVSGAGDLDATGRLVPGRPIVLSLDSYVRDGRAVKGNVTVTGMTGGGVLTVWGSGPRPATSTVNWWTSGQILSNFLFTALGTLGAYHSVLTLQATSSPTHVILDLTGLLVGHPSQVLTGRA
ncbi:hypothetical protein FJK98_25505 [Micromonospora sp. HM134]|uniref:hypothetical protein n=1 Tax=unclassified Micromonospora TaxID=2617518 RepID=UPI0011983792|nr:MULTISPECIES: hypothetical protein [unclassified Micromonospora]QDY10098.1 hypothetical protein FJK98_25505 [Micromonospora sp. HM134]